MNSSLRHCDRVRTGLSARESGQLLFEKMVGATGIIIRRARIRAVIGARIFEHNANRE
jgi:hypothetical protein